MSVSIVSRRSWGAKAWGKTPYKVSASERTEFFVHYHGAPPPTGTGKAVAKNVERIHLDNGWAGVGYNFMVDQDGVIYEGRGWDMVGAHCPNHNRSGIGVYVAIGGDQDPSDAALAAVRDLYDEACERAGKALIKRGHRDGRKTACPGDKLYAWVRGGMDLDEPETYDPSDRPVLRMGSKGRHVEELQRVLAERGHKLDVDGDFGPATNHVVVSFQKGFDLEPDGIVGPLTWGKLLDSGPGGEPTPEPAPAPAPAKRVKEDRHLGLTEPPIRGQDVRNVQHALSVAGYPVPQSGTYDRRTAMAVNDFNKKNGIKVAGTGSDTWAALRKVVHGY